MVDASSISALLEARRLQVAGALVGVQRTSDEIAEQTGLDHRDVLQALGELRLAGLVESTNGSYTLPLERLHELAGHWSDAQLPMDPYIGFGMNDGERAVLSRFFQGRTLAEIPVVRSKRSIVLERIALEFELGRHYPEAAVNDLLRTFHPDCSTLRRYLVDEGLLDRNRETYWRSGGRLDLAPQPDSPSGRQPT